MSPFWQKWLRIACIALIIYGALIAFAVFPALTGPTKTMIELLFWPPLEQTADLVAVGVDRGPHLPERLESFRNTFLLHGSSPFVWFDRS